MSLFISIKMVYASVIVKNRLKLNIIIIRVINRKSIWSNYLNVPFSHVIKSKRSNNAIIKIDKSEPIIIISKIVAILLSNIQIY